jgi:hypothetical protein
MRALIDAYRQPPIRDLIDKYYDMPTVQGLALGVHADFVAMFRSQYGTSSSVNRILESGKVPPAWPAACSAAGFAGTLSPIYVVIYVLSDADSFRDQNGIPKVTQSGHHLVLVETTEPFVELADRSRHRPQIQGGISVGNAALNLAGTLGGFLEDHPTGTRHLLSCLHVLEDAGCTDVLQQGKKDGGQPAHDAVATTAHVVSLKPPAGFSFSAPFNTVDAALARVHATIIVSPHLRLVGAVTAVVPQVQLALGDDVIFVGKESDRQEARVYRFIARLKVTIRGTVHNFGEVFEIEPRLPLYVGSLSRPGDSGAWVVRETPSGGAEVCGLLFAGTKKHAVCSFMETVIGELNSIGGGTFGLA